jgi:hypothetical protein
MLVGVHGVAAVVTGREATLPCHVAFILGDDVIAN